MEHMAKFEALKAQLSSIQAAIEQQSHHASKPIFFSFFNHT
jgi:hypothetical protein